MRTYTFQVVCRSGVTKPFTCEAVDFNQARTLLEQFATAN
jgi:hypothetical protein